MPTGCGTVNTSRARPRDLLLGAIDKHPAKQCQVGHDVGQRIVGDGFEPFGSQTRIDSINVCRDCARKWSLIGIERNCSRVEIDGMAGFHANNHESASSNPNDQDESDNRKRFLKELRRA